MYKDKTFLAIIPARGGSKRLPRKNLLDLDKKPLIAHTINAGLKSKYIDKVLVSSEDDEILQVAKKYGSDILRRPISLATDTASTNDMISHVLKEIAGFDFLILLQPTSPLRDDTYIDEAIEHLFIKEADGVVSVCEMEHSPLWSNTLPEDESMNSFLDESLESKRSQDLEVYYRLNGAIYICKVERFLKEKKLFLPDNIYAYKMEKEVSIDIDEMIDFELVKIYMKGLEDESC